MNRLCCGDRFHHILRIVLLGGLIFPGLIVSACRPQSGAASAGEVSEAGSTTVQPLAEKLASSFIAAHPGLSVTIQGGGSSVGIKSAADGTVDIGASSRELLPGEPALMKHLLARDGIAIIISPENPVNNLTKEQVRDIFSGEITNWRRVGGPDREIHTAAREEGSGTRTAFEELVMGKELVTARAILQPSNGSLRQVVTGDSAAISFISFGTLDERVKAVSIDGVAATAENVRNGSYPLARPLYFLTREAPQGAAKDFIDYCLGPEGQQIVTDEGYVASE